MEISFNPKPITAGDLTGYASKAYTTAAVGSALTGLGIQATGSTIDIGSGAGVSSVSLGCGPGVQTVNVGNTGGGATTINLGGPGDTVSVAGTLTSISNAGIVTIPSGTDTLANLAGTQTLTNKTLIAPVIASISNGGTITIPAGASTLANISTTQTLTNKTLITPIIASISNGGTITIPTGTSSLVNLTTGQTLTNKTLITPIIASISNSGTVSIPIGTDTLVNLTGIQTLGNKIITDITNSVRADSIRNGSTWNVAFSGATPATSQVLGYVGSGNVAFVDPDVPNATNLNTASQIVRRDAGGGFAAGTIAVSSVSCTNNLFAGGNISCFSSIQAGQTTWLAPQAQGAFMGWNRTGAPTIGRAAFMCQQGAGAGGFEWVNYNNSNVLTSPNPVMALDAAGVLTPAAGLILPTTGGTPSTLTFYQEYSYATTFTGAFTTAAITIRVTRIGNVVTITSAADSSSQTAVANGTVASSTVLLSQFRPSTQVNAYLTTQINGVNQQTNFFIQTNGTIGVHGAGYTSGQTAMFGTFTVTYVI